MANEIQVSVVTGLTISVQIYNGAVPVGAPIACAEVGTTGNYVGDLPAGLPYGHYLLIASVVGGDAPVVADGELFWDGAYEMPVGLATVQGLDPNNPATTTQTNLDAGNIHVVISGDQVTNTKLTRS